MAAELDDFQNPESTKKEPKNVFAVAGEEDKLMERTLTANSFYCVSELRTSKKHKSKKLPLNWLVILLCLLAGLLIGTELYVYLTKGTL